VNSGFFRIAYGEVGVDAELWGHPRLAPYLGLEPRSRSNHHSPESTDERVAPGPGKVPAAGRGARRQMGERERRNSGVSPALQLLLQPQLRLPKQDLAEGPRRP
jgi:hypothetical protein